MNTTVGIVIFVSLVAMTAFFVAVEFALVTVDKSAIELQAAQGDWRAVIVRSLLRKLSFYLSGVQLGITVCSVVLGLVAEPVVAHVLRSPLSAVLSERYLDAVSLVVALALATMVQMLLGELIPKAIAIAKPQATARMLGPIIKVYTIVFRPIIASFGWVADTVVRKLGIEPTEELIQVRSGPELAMLVEASKDQGTLDAAEADLLSKVFRFQHKSAAEAMTPRTAIEAISINDPGAVLMEMSRRTGHSRFPVIDHDIDNIVGVVHTKSLLSIDPSQRAAVQASTLASQVLAVPESRDLASLLLEMRSSGQYLAVVVDEYGGTAGIVTMEDLVEEIVGEIEDEYDTAVAHPVIRWGTTILLSGRLTLDEVHDETGVVLPSGEYETLAGFMLYQLGKIPAGGETVVIDQYQLMVAELDRHRIASVRLNAASPVHEHGGSA